MPRLPNTFETAGTRKRPPGAWPDVASKAIPFLPVCSRLTPRREEKDEEKTVESVTLAERQRWLAAEHKLNLESLHPQIRNAQVGLAPGRSPSVCVGRRQSAGERSAADGDKAVRRCNAPREGRQDKGRKACCAAPVRQHQIARSSPSCFFWLLWFGDTVT